MEGAGLRNTNGIYQLSRGGDTGGEGEITAEGARCRLLALRPSEEGGMMDRADILAAMDTLKLYGMRGAFDAVITAIAKAILVRTHVE